MQFCQKHRIHFISDEIYGCSVFDAGDTEAVPFSSALSIDFAGVIDSDLVHVTYGMSKDFAVGGLMIGAIVSRCKPVLQAVQSAIPLHTVSGPTLAIGLAMLENHDWRHSFIESSRTKLAKAYKFVTQELDSMGIEYVRGGNAGFFVYINLSPYLPSDWQGESNADFALARKLIAAGVYLHPREEHPLEPGWFRLVFNWPEHILAEGLQRIRNAVQE
jgi:1-aminocyclopropane-1-carboxylate synthase